MKPKTLLSLALITIIGLAVYGNSLNGKFIWDDCYLIEDNSYIRDWSNIAKIFTKDIAAGSGIEFTSYRPLQTLTYIIDYSLWRLDVRGYHFTNILLHILAALSIYWLINILYNDRFLSLFTSLLFVTHPIHVGAVAYISGRADPLAAVFILLCIIFYIKSLHAKNITLYILMLLCYIFALLARENSLILPALLLLYHYAFKVEVKTKRFLPILGITLVYILLRLTVLKTPLPHVLRPTTLLQRIPGVFVAITSYIRLLFLPFGLHMEYGNKLFDFSHPLVIPGIIIVVFLSTYAFRKRKVNKVAFFSILWFFIALLPVSNLYPIDAYMAEHWLYLPSIGFFLILAKALCYLYRTKKFRIFAGVFIICLLIFYSYLTIRQNNYWNKPMIFYERALRYAQDSWRMHNNLGNVYKESGHPEAAIAEYNKALEIKPDYAQAYYNLGNLYNDIKKYEEAIASYKKATEIKQNFGRAYNNLAVSYNAVGRYKEAIDSCKEAIEINPGDAYAHINLAIAYYNEREYGLAVRHCDIALKLGAAVDKNFLRELQKHRE